MNIKSAFIVILLSNTANTDDVAADKRDLTKEAASPEVSRELEGPDEATMQLTPEGGWRIFAIGRGTYDLDDNDDIQQARQEAMLQAKAHISKFMGETVTSDETLGRLSERFMGETVTRRSRASSSSGS